MSADQALPPITIAPNEWEIVSDILRRHAPGIEVWAFGSRATRTAARYSDLDLALLHPEEIPLSVLATLIEAFDASDLPFKVDVIDLTYVAPTFRKIIEKDWVPLSPYLAISL